MSSHTSSQLGLSGQNLVQTRMCKGLGTDREEYDLSFPLIMCAAQPVLVRRRCWAENAPLILFPFERENTCISNSLLHCFCPADMTHALPSQCSTLTYTPCPVPRDQVIPLTVIIVNKSFTLLLPGKNWTCVALLDKKCCEQTTENSI